MLLQIVYLSVLHQCSCHLGNTFYYSDAQLQISTWMTNISLNLKCPFVFSKLLMNNYYHLQPFPHNSGYDYSSIYN